MSAESDFFSLLSAAAGVTALVGQRIYPDVLPEKCAYPAIVFARSTTDIERLLNGDIATQRIEVAVAAWAKNRNQADAVIDAARAALAGTPWEEQGQIAGFDPETGLFAAQMQVDRFY